MNLNNKGFTTMTLALTLLIVPIACLVGLRFYNTIQNGTQLQKSSTTKSQLTSIKYWLMAQAADPDSDGNAEILKEVTGNALPLALPFKTSDEWGKNYRYYTWDLGTANTNATYSQNNTAPPLAGLIGRVVSAGKDGTFQTSNSSTTAQGDDIMFDISNTDVQNNTNTSGWFEDVVNNTVALLTGGRKVGIGTASPQDKLEVYGAGRFGSAGFGQIRIGRDDGSNNWIETLDSNRNIVLAANGTGKFIINSDTTINANLTIGGTTTSTGAMQARGGIGNDTGAYLNLLGGTTGKTQLSGALRFPDGTEQTSAAGGGSITNTYLGTIISPFATHTFQYTGSKIPISLTVAVTLNAFSSANNQFQVQWLDSNMNVIQPWIIFLGINQLNAPDGGAGLNDTFCATVPFFPGTAYIQFRRTAANGSNTLRLLWLQEQG